jgi:hypothetical protein
MTCLPRRLVRRSLPERRGIVFRHGLSSWGHDVSFSAMGWQGLFSRQKIKNLYFSAVLFFLVSKFLFNFPGTFQEVF